MWDTIAAATALRPPALPAVGYGHGTGLDHAPATGSELDRLRVRLQP